MKAGTERRKDSFALGVALLAIGLLFILNSLGVHVIAGIWRFWPLILIWMGITKLQRARKQGRSAP